MRGEPIPQENPAPAGDWQLAWAVVFVTNLLAPLGLGLLVTQNGGRLGMFAAVGLVWLMGHLAVTRWDRFRAVLVAGGWCTALSQLFPVLQVVAGMMSLSAVGHRNDSHLTEVDGFVATLLTAGQLLAVALFCGVIVRAISLIITGGQRTDGARG